MHARVVRGGFGSPNISITRDNDRFTESITDLEHITNRRT